VSGVGASGATTVTAFLRPGAQLVEVFAIPGAQAQALARVSFTGVPSGLGLSKDTVVLLTE
jgi:predicted membrane protein